MALITIPFTFSAGAIIVASQHNSCNSVIYSDYNGNIDNTNIATNAAIAYSKLNLATSILNADINASAGIVDTKLAQITTASKVSGTAITGLASLPSGAGVIPAANLPTNIHGSQVFTSSGTFTAPAGVTIVYVTMAGAGGSGAGPTFGTNGGGGGGGANCMINVPYVVTPASNYTVIIGTAAGGAAGANGNDGGQSSFDGVLICLGGSKGLTSGTGGAGAAAVSANASTITAGKISQIAGGTGGNGTAAQGGAGGGSLLSAGAASPASGGDTSGIAAKYGAGGSGGSINTSSGGATTGVCIVMY